MTDDPVLNSLPALTARARRLSRHRADAEDLVHDAVLAYLEQRARGRRIDHAQAYLMTAMRHRHIARARRAQRDTDLPEEPLAPGDAAETLYCQETLAALDRLPPRDRELMRLVAAGETRPAEIARRLGIKPGTAMSRLARARSRLRQLLGEERGAP